METDPQKLKAIWNQEEIPVVLRRGGKGEKLRIKLPDAPDNRILLQSLGKHHPVWFPEKGYWETPKRWFNGFVEKALTRHGRLYIIQPYREREVCARACMNAQGHECNCSCMGANHGSGVHGSWFEVSEYFAVRTSKPELACRLLRLV